jgi:hypothetical protein
MRLSTLSGATASRTATEMRIAGRKRRLFGAHA